MKERITISMSAGGELEIFLNPAGRDLLVRELLGLGESNYHFHLMPSEWGAAEVELSMRAYRETDTIVAPAKIYFRTDEWDREYFPHVLDSGG